MRSSKKEEQNLLRQRLGLTKEQFKQMKYQKSVLDAQEEYSKQLKEGADSLLGLDIDHFNIAAGRLVDEKGSFIAGIDNMVKMQGEFVAGQQKAMASENAGASKRIEAENRKEREASKTYQIFEKIAGSIEELGEGIKGIKADDVGKGLLAPIGLIGGIIVSFVGGFVGEVKRQFDLLKAVFGKGGDLVKGFGKLLTSVKNTVKTITPNFILDFFTGVKNTLSNMKTSFTGLFKGSTVAADVASRR